MQVGEIDFVIVMLVLWILLIAVVAFVLYWIIRLAVKHGLRSSHEGVDQGSKK
ncbi:hypothetical protein GCM10027404_34670 [Arthrobacter tumbae]|nr:hypothetical protein [Arthrobacter tumbae]